MLEKLFLLFLCIISAFLYFITFNFEVFEMDKYSLGPAFFPRFICIILFLIALILLIFSIKNKNFSKIKDKSSNLKYSVVTIILFIIYIFLIERLGYLTSTIMFMISIIFLLKSKSLLINIIFSVVFSSVIYLLFSKGFNVSLPEGIFI
ncbi:tripartite tricarboxylate transporter TctB family protein [Fusobacterium periodonticum]|uniref:tripartite tricarboxylate transporter TctB family protein n=1 Tax=Fusobacterium periodonticum TaxID=860 RepID=UPI0028D77EAD|nr:tripartite tricarboxylate transporter TctB family protein [Fusobacterium periodonticum]